MSYEEEDTCHMRRRIHDGAHRAHWAQPFALFQLNFGSLLTQFWVPFDSILGLF
jgi:hypothetical protein